MPFPQGLVSVATEEVGGTVSEGLEAASLSGLHTHGLGTAPSWDPVAQLKSLTPIPPSVALVMHWVVGLGLFLGYE